MQSFLLIINKIVNNNKNNLRLDWKLYALLRVLIYARIYVSEPKKKNIYGI